MGWIIAGVVLGLALLGYVLYQINKEAYPEDEPEWLE